MHSTPNPPIFRGMLRLNFKLNVLLRVMLILGLGYGMVYILAQTHFWLVAFWIGLVMLLLVSDLLRYLLQSHRELENMLIAIRHGEFSSTRNTRLQTPAMQQAYARAMHALQQLRQEKETNHLYLQNVVEHVNIALLCFEAEGKFILTNRAAIDLLQKPFLKELNDLKTIDYELFSTIKKLEANERSLVKIIINGQLLNLLVQVTEFKMQGEYYKLVSLQDFRSELEEQEIESWQKLIRVLTHEIMNSVIPITNLSGMVNQMLEDPSGRTQYRNLATLEADEIDDLHGSLQTIENRSKGLSNFVKAYKSLTQMGEPTFKNVAVQSLLERVQKLMQGKLTENKIFLHIKVSPEDIAIKGDPELLEQMLINLVINAIEALSGVSNPQIRLLAQSNDDNKTEIVVADNGPGIPADIQEQIFVPFYTTKKTGSGIGLSLTRQIMRLHKGAISVQSSFGNGTSILLIF